MHFKYAKNSIKRMTFKNSKSLSSVTVVFNLCIKTPMASGHATAISKKKKKKERKDVAL